MPSDLSKVFDLSFMQLDKQQQIIGEPMPLRTRSVETAIGKAWELARAAREAGAAYVAVGTYAKGILWQEAL